MDTRLRDAFRAVSAAATEFLERTGDRQFLLQTVVQTVAGVVPDLALLTLTSGDMLTAAAVHDDDPAARGVYAALVGVPRPVSALAANAFRETVFWPAIELADLEGHLRADSLAALRSIGARGMIVVPMRSRGELLGLLSVVRHRPDRPPLDEGDRELTEYLAHYAAMALGIAKLSGEQEARENRMEASRFLDAIIENIPNMVFVKDARDLRFVRFNRAGEDLLGVPRSALLGKTDRDLFVAEEAEFFIAKDRETLAARTLVDIPEEPIATSTGQRWLHTKKVPVLDDAGAPLYLLGISEDITERKDALAKLGAAKEKAEAANRELEAFSYSVAHDLRSPLRAIDGFAQALIEDHGTSLDEQGVRLLERIYANAQRMGALIDDLLRLSRLTRAELRRERVDLAAIARASVAALERAEPGRTVDVSIARELPALGDSKLLAVMLDNLLANAWKFTSKVEHARIDIGATRRGGEIVYTIRDNGAGFDMAYGGKLFGVFQRLHAVHEFPGTGVGLATVKRVVERHGGRVWAEGAVGQGATFFFTLGEDAP